ncbi:SDR family NAD(P)-dependent oxidoreductase [Chloroflexota bacterium]
MISLENKVAVVTGAARSIGQGCAKLLGAYGARVALVDCDSSRLVETTTAMPKTVMARGYELDVTNIEAIDPTISQIIQELGEVDILVCSAGKNIKKLAVDVTENIWDDVNSLNIRSLFFCNQAVAIQSMIPRRGGAIVNIASQAGLIGEPLNAAYCASKGGVIALTRQEAIEWAPHNVRVNAVAPTWVFTDWVSDFLKENPEIEQDALRNIPLRRMATVDDVAAAVCFLASDAASVITGVTLPVDGGWTAQ